MTRTIPLFHGTARRSGKTSRPAWASSSLSAKPDSLLGKFQEVQATRKPTVTDRRLVFYCAGKRDPRDLLLAPETADPFTGLFRRNTAIRALDQQ